VALAAEQGGEGVSRPSSLRAKRRNPSFGVRGDDGLLRSILFAAALALSSAPAHAVVLDLSTMTCKQFIEGGDDTIKMVLTWMDGWYKGDSDEAIIDTDVFVENAKKFGAYCGKNPTISIVNAAESVLGK
jgi:acid stress chaperone HdeB